MSQELHWIGYAAATLTTLAFVPQAWLTLRTRQVEGISALTYSALTLGIGLWLAYGVALGDWALIVANSVTFPLAACVLVVKLAAMKKARQVAG
jgi:MtN3 and saliva related transmembrane protein